MKKSSPLKILFIVLLSLTAIFFAAFSAFLIITADAKIDENKLIKVEGGFEYYDSTGALMAEEVGGNSVTSNEKIPDHVKKAFVAIEDKRFYKHRGVDFKALFRATVNNLKSFSFKEGGSTITQQLIKNTHLSGEKTFKRKLSEIRLANELEKKYDKDEILEKYLNTIYFGSGAYGITDASRVYFDKRPEDLSINEAAVLAAIIKAPSLYSPAVNTEKSEKRKNLVLREMLSQGYIEKKEYDKAASYFPNVAEGNKTGDYGYLYIAEKEASSVFGDGVYYGGRKKIYTAYEKDKQNAIESVLKNDGAKCDKSAVMINSEGKIVAFYSTIPETKRQAGSTLKPLVVYAPAIETGAVSEMTPILDEKTDFNGYSPANYNDKYYGYVSVKDSLAKSLNVCATKILNYVGIEKAKSYLSKTDVELTDKDDSLCVALGCTENGVFLKNLIGAYGVFQRGGNYISPTVLSEKNETGIKLSERYGKRIFSRGTCDVMNDMLSFTVENGTAKKLSFLGIPIYAKTGTVGNKNGNTDAYCVSYTSEYAVGVWYGNGDGTLMSNSVTGGTLPAERSAEIWKSVYKSRKPAAIEKSDESVVVKLDKISYDNDRVLVAADENAPERYISEGLFTKNNLPQIKSERFSAPKIESGEILVNNNEIMIRLCLTQLYGAEVYRTEGGHRELVFDVKGSPEEIVLSDNTTSTGKLYEYSVVPYYKNEKNCFYGKEILLGKIKTPQKCGADEWWKDDFE